MKETYPKTSVLDALEKWIKKVEKMHADRKKPSRKRAIRKLKLPYKVIGSGRSRIVYDLKDGFVLKIAYSEKGIRDNASEAVLYESAKAAIKKHLAKVIEHGNGWCIMEKIHGSPASTSKKNKDFVYKLRKKFEREGISPNDLTNRRNDEPRWKNFRIDPKGRIVVIDYANFKKS